MARFTIKSHFYRNWPTNKSQNAASIKKITLTDYDVFFFFFFGWPNFFNVKLEITQVVFFY